MPEITDLKDSIFFRLEVPKYFVGSSEIIMLFSFALNVSLKDCQISSVMKGIMGWANLSVFSKISNKEFLIWAFSALAMLWSLSLILQNSMYQSHNFSQMNS